MYSHRYTEQDWKLLTCAHNACIERADTPRCCYHHLKGVGEGARLRLKYTLDGEEDSGGVKILVGLYLEHQKDPGPGKCTKLEALSVLTGMRALNRNRPAL